VVVAGWLLIIGSLLVLVGVYLPWVSEGGDSISGMDNFLMSDFTIMESPGVVALIGGVIGLGFGIALLAAGRVLVVAILAVVFSAIGVLLGIGLVAIAADSADTVGADISIGAILQPIGPIVALAGSIVALAKRRMFT
jgi:hypothetical protein